MEHLIISYSRGRVSLFAGGLLTLATAGVIIGLMADFSGPLYGMGSGVIEAVPAAWRGPILIWLSMSIVPFVLAIRARVDRPAIDVDEGDVHMNSLLGGIDFPLAQVDGIKITRSAIELVLKEPRPYLSMWSGMSKASIAHNLLEDPDMSIEKLKRWANLCGIDVKEGSRRKATDR